MIAEYESSTRSHLLDAPRQYGIAQQHKHLKEMKAICSLQKEPLFCPIVADFYSGMELTVPLFRQQLAPGCSIDDVRACYAELYRGPVVNYVDAADENGFISAGALSGRDSMEISVYGNDERMLLVSRFDNLGKGASGAAIECMNMVLGCNATTGLDL